MMSIKDFTNFFRKKQEVQRNDVAERTAKERQKTEERKGEYDTAANRLNRALDRFNQKSGT